METAGIDKKNIAIAVADRLMGMAIDNAVRLGKYCPHPLLDIVSRAGTMTDADYLVFNLNHSSIGELLLDGHIAHVAVDGIKYFGLKYLKYNQAGYIAGMENHLTIVECLVKVILKPLIYHGHMRVRQNSCAYHVLVSSP